MLAPYDIAIIGGGINGCGIARDAAGRGHTVYLCEMNDLASGTSSWSTKLIHGGLRYLEYGEFRLVRESLLEREVLWQLAPHLIHPLRFILPYHDGLRPKWLLRLGLFIYDHLGGRRLLPATRTINLQSGALGEPLTKGRFTTGFEYSDCLVDDARLVVANAHAAASLGAVIETRTLAQSARRADGQWELTVTTAGMDAQRTIKARTLVNAGGPWADLVLRDCANLKSKSHVRLVQGSHIVVPALFAHGHAYIFQNRDGRVIFAIPYEGRFTLIGTTDCDYAGDPAAVAATADDIDYLCTAVSDYFEKPVRPADVVWAYSGVRPLYNDGASEAKATTREYVFELDAPEAEAPLLSIFGGKITTYRRLADSALEKLAPFLPPKSVKTSGWTATSPLPGGNMPVNGGPALVKDLMRRYPFLVEPHAERLAMAYGTLAGRVLNGAKTITDLGEQFGGTLTEAEVVYLMTAEWARTADDVVWRRSKLGLSMSTGEIARLSAWMVDQRPAVVASEKADQK